ncbi:MAG: hypothetical protein K2I52_03900, partial [Muribaculaceae bacterium]|nr:hypothetical protein [Muribaculaceae bacterium]
YEAPIIGNIATLVTDDGQHVSVGATETRDRSFRLSLMVNGRETYHRKRLVPDPDREFLISITLDKTQSTARLRMLSSETEQEIDLSRSRTVTVTFGPDDSISRPYSVPMELQDILLYRDNIHTHHWDLRYHDTDTTIYDEISGDIVSIRNPSWLICKHVNWSRIYSHPARDWVKTEFSSRYDMFSIIDDDNIVNFNPLNCISTSSANTRGRDISDDLIHRYPHLDEMSGVRYRIDSRTSTVEKIDLYTHHTEVHHLIPPLLPTCGLSVAAVNDRLYIFSLLESPKLHPDSTAYDKYAALYEYNTASWSRRVLWELTLTDYNFCPTSEMYYDNDDDCFYFASIENGGCIIRISRSSPEWDIVSAPAFNHIDMTDAKVNLYRGSESNRYHLVVNRRIDMEKRLIDIYTISAPFLHSLSDLMSAQNTVTDVSQNTPLCLILIISSILTLATVPILIKWRYRYPRNKEKKTDQSHKILPAVNFDRSHSSISLLGTFCVRDKNGKDITFRFTTRLKHLLIMLLLSEAKDNGGIDYRKIDQEIWGNKDDKSAQNNRNVSMRKLRLLLEDVGDMVITYDKGKYRVDTDAVMLDYRELLSRIDRNDIINHVSPEKAEEILTLLSMGPLLPDTSFYWLDNIKSKFSERILSILTDWLHTELDHDDNIAYRIAETLSIHSPLNEEALRAKCIILMRRKMPILANNIYTQYCSDYLTANNHAYPTSLATLCAIRQAPDQSE